MMLADPMDAEIRKWGNSFAIRLPKTEMDRLGLHEGDRVEVELRKAKAGPRRKVSLAGMPLARDDVADVSARHDEYLYGGRP